MTGIASLQESQYIRMMLIGESGTGKTGSLASLVAAGYNLGILDLEGKTDILFNYLRDQGSPYLAQLKKIGRDTTEALDEAVNVVTITEEMVMNPVSGNIGPLTGLGQNGAWTRIAETLNKWPGKGKPAEWGPDHILVVDGLTAISDYANNFFNTINKHTDLTVLFDGRTDIRLAQVAVERFLSLLCQESFKCHVIIISHIVYPSEDPALPVGFNKIAKGYPASVGRAILPRIPRKFSNMVLSDIENKKHKLFTETQGAVNLKSSAPMRMSPSYPLEWGLAEIFRELRNGVVPQAGSGKGNIVNLKGP